MARMTINEARARWSATPPVGAEPGWPSRATIRKWITLGKVRTERVVVGHRQNGNEVVVHFILDSEPPARKTTRAPRAKKPKAPPVVQETTSVAGLHRPARRGWPF